MCCCQDFARRGELTWCKHLLCVAIIERLERLEADREQLADAPIDLELTPEAYAALDALGEPADLPLQCHRCHAEPSLPSHRDHLGAACIARELFGDDAA